VLCAHQRSVLQGIARETWRFYAADVDPVTHLPLDNLGPGATRGAYTSAANIGVYLWAVLAARDLGLISPARAEQLAGDTLDEVATLKRFDGFLYQWYDTGNGRVLENPGQLDCTSTTPTMDSCWFVSAVDNGWYASGLIEIREALPALEARADGLLSAMARPVPISRGRANGRSRAIGRPTPIRKRGSTLTCGRAITRTPALRSHMSRPGQEGGSRARWQTSSSPKPAGAPTASG